MNENRPSLPVLIVDDDPLFVELLRRALAGRGFVVQSACNGREALEIIHRSGPPLVLTDWVMPEMDGLELCRRIRDSEEIGFTYVIVLTANETLEHMTAAFEAGADDYITKPFTKAEVFARLKAAERIVRLEGSYHRHTLQLHKVNAEVAVMNGELDRMSHVLAEARDEAVRLRVAADEANQTKSRFLASTSHEIRTPLTAIMGFTDILRYESELSSSTEEFEEAIDIIRRNCDHLLSLLNDVLDFSKIEAGEVSIQYGPCRLTDLVAHVTTAMRERAAAKGIELKTDWGADAPNVIQTDSTRLRQVLLNLVNNAIKFSRQGTVTVGVRRVEAGPTAGVELAVIDTGIGMAAADLARIFEPFVQADAGLSNRQGGVGLGLAICKRLVEALEGTIAVSSEPGVGSRFTVRLPLVEIEAKTASTTPEPTPAKSSVPRAVNLEGREILVAEDGVDNQRLIRRVLEKAKARVTCVENGQLAIETALVRCRQGRPFDLILMDMQMPVLDGFSAVRRLRQEGYTWPIVALTAEAMAGDRQRCLDIGCDDYMSKPFNPRGLLTMLEKFKLTPAESPA